MSTDQDAGQVRRERRGTQRVRLFSLLLAVLAGVLALVGVPGSDEPTVAVLAVCAALIAAFALTESVVLHAEIGESAHSASLVEIPLVLGLFLLPAPLLVVARVVGALVGLRLYRRQSWNKISFNLCMMSLEVVVAVTVFHALLSLDEGQGFLQLWTISLLSCLVSSAVSSVAVLSVISLATGTAQFGDARALLRDGSLAAVGNGTVGYLAVDALQRQGTAAVPLLLLGAGITLAYRIHVRLRSRYDRLTSIYGFVRGVDSAEDVPGTMGNVLVHARAISKAESAVLTLVDQTGAGAPVLLTVTLDDAGLRSERRSLGGADWPVSRALSTAQPLLVQRGTRDRAVAEWLTACGLRDAVMVVVPGESEPVGTLLVGSRRGEHSTFEATDVLALEGVAGHAAVALRNARLLDRLTHESRHDSLTGLPNRSEFERRVTAALGSGGPAAVLFMDLDRFKDVNDTLGHQAGDTLLVEVARRLRDAVDVECTVARLGGDEFGVLLQGTRAVAVRLAESLRRELERPVGVEGMHVDVGVSIGLAVAPEHGDSAGLLMRRADVAMYDAKALHGIAVYDPARDESSTSRLALVAQLRQALADDAFVLHYQPQVAVSGEPLRCEALIRWPTPAGLVPPDDFLPVAERAGLLQGLTSWVLTRALDDLVAWRAEGHDVGVAVNLSPRNLLETGLAGVVRRLLQERELPADCLTLEITEGSIMAEPERAIATLEALRVVGVRLSVDDFGTGYSSLSYLRRLPVDEVKVDKSFVRGLARDEQDAAIVQAVVTLARSLRLTVVAEGVEDEGAQQRLTELGVDVLQGYHLSRPVPAAAVPAWLRARSPADPRVLPLFPAVPRSRSLA